MNEEFLLKTVI